MVTLLKLGRKTQLESKWIEALGETEIRIKVLADGIILGEYKNADEAESEAKLLLESDTQAKFCVQDYEGRLTNWVYDLDAQRRLDVKSRWRNGLLTAPILGFINWIILILIGFSPFAILTSILVAVPLIFFFIVLTCQNNLESIIAWLIVSILLSILLTIASSQIKEKIKAEQDGEVNSLHASLTIGVMHELQEARNNQIDTFNPDYAIEVVIEFGNLCFDLEGQRFGEILGETFWVREEEYSHGYSSLINRGFRPK